MNARNVCARPASRFGRGRGREKEETERRRRRRRKEHEAEAEQKKFTNAVAEWRRAETCSLPSDDSARLHGKVDARVT